LPAAVRQTPYWQLTIQLLKPSSTQCSPISERALLLDTFVLLVRTTSNPLKTTFNPS
jgi:hypothetical protein